MRWTGIPRDTLIDDPRLGNKRYELAVIAARRLSDLQMITYDTRNGSLVIKDLGRIAARYYIRHSSVEIFNQEMKPRMSHADVLAMLSMSTEVESSASWCGRD
jgi:antiviral helicase SLH1